MTRFARPVTLILVALILATSPSPPAAHAGSVTALARGKLLVANESVKDPNFAKTVVLLLHYGESGAMGIVLNRPSPHRLEDFLPEADWAGRAEEPIFVGGPVAATHTTILFATDGRHADQMPVVGSVQATWSLDVLEQMLTDPDPDPDDRFRIYAGHAGWAPGQLEAEVERLGWYIFAATEADIFASGEEGLWSRYIRRTRTLIARGDDESPFCPSPSDNASC